MWYSHPHMVHMWNTLHTLYVGGPHSSHDHMWNTLHAPHVEKLRRWRLISLGSSPLEGLSASRCIDVIFLPFQVLFQCHLLSARAHHSEGRVSSQIAMSRSWSHQSKVHSVAASIFLHV
jgi:hypothetical protein